MTKAPVNQTIPSSTVDGPGSRTSVSLQECNITCGYCHNPGTQNLCDSCGVCVLRCPEGVFPMVDGAVVWDESKCISCSTCIEVCPYHASLKIRWMDTPAVTKEVKKNIPFIRGITISGGECELYSQLLQELFTLARAKGLICPLDSNGNVRFSKYPELMKVCDGVMLNIKAWSPGIFRAFTGGDNAAVKKNFLFLPPCGKLGEVHIVNVEGHVDMKDVIRGTAELLGSLIGNTRLLLTSFRDDDVKGPFAVFSFLSAERVEQLAEPAASVGFRNIIVE